MKVYYICFLSILVYFNTVLNVKAEGTTGLEFGICVDESDCKRCIERFKLSFWSDFEERRVVAIGSDKGGKAIWREYQGCQMEDATNWRCSGFHGDYVSRSGDIKLESNSKTIYHLRKLKICNF